MSGTNAWTWGGATGVVGAVAGTAGWVSCGHALEPALAWWRTCLARAIIQRIKPHTYLEEQPVKYLQTAIALCLVVLAAACGSHAPTSTTPPAAHASTSATTPAPDLNSELLAVSDLPAGWSVVGNTESGATPTCFVTARSLVLKANTRAQVTFVYGSNSIPVLTEGLAYLPGRAQSSLAAALQSISRCGQISMTSGGVTLTGTVSPLSFPAVADQSSAYQVNLSGTAAGTSITLDLDEVVFRKGDTVAVILYADLGTPDITVLQQAVQHAAAKMA